MLEHFRDNWWEILWRSGAGVCQATDWRRHAGVCRATDWTPGTDVSQTADLEQGAAVRQTAAWRWAGVWMGGSGTSWGPGWTLITVICNRFSDAGRSRVGSNRQLCLLGAGQLGALMPPWPTLLGRDRKLECSQKTIRGKLHLLVPSC